MARARTTGILLPAILAFAWLTLAAPVTGQTTYFLTSFGAVCDGTTNDSAAIQNAFNTVKNGDILQFPAGQICYHTQTLTINNGIGFVLEGNDALLRVAKGVQGTIIKRSHGYTIRNLSFDGSNQLSCPSGPIQGCACDTCSKDLLLLRGSTRANAAVGEVTLPAQLSNVTAIRSTRAGIRVRGYFPDNNLPGVTNNPTTDLTITACNALDNRINGLALGAAERIDILGGTYADTGAGSLPGLGELPGAGIDIESELGETTRDVLISGATLRDNYGAGVQIAASEVAGIPDDVTLFGNTIRANLRSAVRVKATNLTISNNLFEDFDQPSFDQDAAIQISPFSRDIVLDDNTFRRFTTGQEVIQVDSDAERVTISDNHFEDIETGASVIWARAGVVDVDVTGNAFDTINVVAGTGAAILHKAINATITGNSFHDLGDRGIWSTATGADIAGNTFSCMRGNAIWASDDDARIEANVLGPPAVAGSGAASQAVIRSRGNGGTVNGNIFACLGTTQRGIVLDFNPDQVNDNQVTNCDASLWLQFLNGQGTTTVTGNLRTTGTVLACTP